MSPGEPDAEAGLLVLWEALEVEVERMPDDAGGAFEATSGAFAGLKRRMVRSEEPVRI